MSESSVDESPVERLMGDGPFPDELDRLNWSAVLWSGWWALVYGAWLWMLAFIGLAALSFGAGWWARGAGTDSPLVVSVLVAVHLAGWALRVVFGYRANRFAWRLDGNRRELAARRPAGPRPHPVAKYLGTQRVWMWLGLALTAWQLAASLVRAWGTPAFAAALALEAVEVVVLLSLFIYARRTDGVPPRS